MRAQPPPLTPSFGPPSCSQSKVSQFIQFPFGISILYCEIFFLIFSVKILWLEFILCVWVRGWSTQSRVSTMAASQLGGKEVGWLLSSCYSKGSILGLATLPWTHFKPSLSCNLVSFSEDINYNFSTSCQLWNQYTYCILMCVTHAFLHNNKVFPFHFVFFKQYLNTLKFRTFF